MINMRCSLSNIKKNLKNVHVISWLMLSTMLMYVFLSILIEFQDWHMAIYALLSLPLLIAINQVLNEEKKKVNFPKIDYYQGVFAFLGVILTYFISHQLTISPVISSSAVGLMGFLLIKKYSVAIYCGSFAGMVSSLMFGYAEVGLIALICGFLFILSKPIYKGIGGKLGATAFISTMLVAFILGKDFLIIDHEISFLRLVLISMLGTLSTYYFQHLLKQSAVFASAITSLVFAIIIHYIVDDFLPCAIVFFSASFVGMSSKERLPNIIYVLIAALVHAFLFFVYFEHYNGLGGKLGLMAMTSVLISVGIHWLVSYIKKQK